MKSPLDPLQHVPAFHNPHACPVCGNETTWEQRQMLAQSLEIHGLTVKEIGKMREWAIERGYKL